MKFLYLILLSLTIFSCDFKSDEEKINESFNAYKKGVLEDNPELATSMLHSKTFDYFGEILFSVREDDSTELIQIPVYDRLVVLITRHLFSPDSINNLTEVKFLQSLITENFIDKESVQNNSLGEISINEEFARVKVIIDGEISMFYYDFYFVDNEWLFDLSPICRLANEILNYSIEDSGMEANDFLLMSIEEESNKLTDSTIWIPTELR